MRTSYYTAALAAALLLAPGSAPAEPQSDPATTSFVVFLRGSAVGSEELGVASDAGGVTLTVTNRLGPPVNLVVRKATLRYDASWHPVEFALDATVRDQWTSVYTRFVDGTATSDIYEIGQQATRTAKVSPDAVVLSSTFFGGYHAMTTRLSGLAPGSELPLFYAPQGEITAKLTGVDDEQLRSGSMLIPARRYAITIMNPGVPLDIELWADAAGGFMRLSVPAQALEVVRRDIATVSTRIEAGSRPNDERPMIPGNGFNIASTISLPSDYVPAKNRRLPAVILVGGTGPTDRDETTAGIPVFAELAGAIADAGFLVVRFDKRGSGQSGGRPESATLAEYASDVRSIVQYLRKRKDVDKGRIALVGHGEGGWIALATARAEKSVAALALLATAGSRGADLVLEQQRAVLAKAAIPEEERQARVDLQQRIHRAVLTGAGWETIAPAVRKQAETPWFQSYLAFDPAALLARIERPVLVLHGELDREVAVGHAAMLGVIAEKRKPRKGQTTTVARIPQVNHLLVRAETGEIDEYARFTGATLDAGVVSRLTGWLTEQIGQARR